jgi:hypothetical protein
LDIRDCGVFFELSLGFNGRALGEVFPWTVEGGWSLSNGSNFVGWDFLGVRDGECWFYFTGMAEERRAVSWPFEDEYATSDYGRA